VLHILENPEVGSPDYRQSENFFRRCTEVRVILGGEDHGQEA
jgi:hypothetical protein